MLSTIASSFRQALIYPRSNATARHMSTKEFKKQSDILRPSSTLLIIVPKDHPVPGDADFDILMLKRNSRGSFANGIVFPGGNVDVQDDNPHWKELAGNHAESFIPSNSKLPNLAYAICAIRETFEECGLLITDPPLALSSNERHHLRERIKKDPSYFLEFLKLLNTPPACRDLVPFSRWVTPPDFSKRFDTHFFITFLSYGDRPATVQETELPHHNTVPCVDNTEITQLYRRSPRQVLKQFADQGKLNNNDEAISLFPPQWYSLYTLCSYMSWRDLRQDVTSKWEDIKNGTKELLYMIPENVRETPEDKGEEWEDKEGIIQIRNLDASSNEKLRLEITVFPGDELHSTSQGKSEFKGKLHRTRSWYLDGSMIKFKLIKGVRGRDSRI